MYGAGGQSAKGVSQRLLDVTGTALLGKDFEGFARCFHLPHVIETPERKTVLETRHDLRAVFDRVVEDYMRKQITDLVRVCDVAEFRSATRIEATHVTHMMSGSLRVTDPFPTFSVLEWIGAGWRISASQYAVDKNTTVGRALSTM